MARKFSKRKREQEMEREVQRAERRLWRDRVQAEMESQREADRPRRAAQPEPSPWQKGLEETARDLNLGCTLTSSIACGIILAVLFLALLPFLIMGGCLAGLSQLFH